MISHQAIIMASCHIIKHLQSYSIQPMMQRNAVHPLKFSPKRPNSKSQIENFKTQIPSPTQCLFLPSAQRLFVHSSVEELGPLLLEQPVPVGINHEFLDVELVRVPVPIGTTIPRQGRLPTVPAATLAVALHRA